MKKYNIITYRLNKSVTPADVLQVLEELMENCGVYYRNCLFGMDVIISEFEAEGTFHSNRKKNAIISVCKKYPAFKAFCEYSKEDKGENHIDEVLSVNNFSKTDYSQKGKMDYSVVREVVTKIPHPYSVNSLELVFDGICFPKNNDIERIRPSQSGFGAPVGNYILYERSSFGSEKHSYVCFSAGDSFDDMRNLFFEFADRIPGKYEGAEVKI